jgi:hypothetical protein
MTVLVAKTKIVSGQVKPCRFEVVEQHGLFAARMAEWDGEKWAVAGTYIYCGQSRERAMTTMSQEFSSLVAALLRTNKDFSVTDLLPIGK